MDSTYLAALQQNTAVLEWHGGIMAFGYGVILGGLFVGLVGYALLRGR